MGRQEFMEQLEGLLGDVPQTEREEALRYYEDYLEDAGVEKEADVLEELGSPAQVADSIRAGLEEGKPFAQESSDPLKAQELQTEEGKEEAPDEQVPVTENVRNEDGQKAEEPAAMDMEAYMKQMEARAEEKNASRWEIPEPSVSGQKEDMREEANPESAGWMHQESQTRQQERAQQGYGPGHANYGPQGQPNEGWRNAQGGPAYGYGNNGYGPGPHDNRWQGQPDGRNGRDGRNAYQSQYQGNGPWNGPWQGQGNGGPGGAYYGGGPGGYGQGYGRPPYGANPGRRYGRRSAGEILLLILLGIFVIPIVVPLFLGVLAAVLGLLLALVVGLAALVIAGIAVLIAGIVMIGVAFAKIFVAPMAAVYLMGGGMVCTGLGLALTVLMAWLMAKVVPMACRGFVSLCKWPFRKRMG